jgi:hypothetical protein
VVTLNAAEVAPAGTVTEAGVVAAVVIDDVRETGRPPEGAGPVRVTVPEIVVAPTASVLASVMADSVIAAGWNVSVALACVPPCEAVIVTGVGAPIASQRTVICANEAPAATVAPLGNVIRSGRELLNVSGIAEAAGPSIMT